MQGVFVRRAFRVHASIAGYDYLQAHFGPRTCEVLSTVNKPLDGADYDNHGEGDYAIVCRKSVTRISGPTYGVHLLMLLPVTGSAGGKTKSTVVTIT